MVHVFCDLEEIGDDLTPMCDMAFEIIEKKYDKSTSCWRLVFCADATPYEPVGFGAIVPVSGWREQTDGDDDDPFHSFWGLVTLFSIGVESDRLLALIADYYKVPVPSLKRRSSLDTTYSNEGGDIAKAWKFANSIQCLAVGLNSSPALLADSETRMKLFFDDGIENGRYAEVFFNVDLPEGIAALNEKDESYRTDLVHWFSVVGDVIAHLHSDQH